MKFTKATKSSTISYGVYRIDRDYLSSLRKNDEKVMDPDITDRYCGPVFTADTERGLVDFFVPIDPVYKTHETCLLANIDGVFANCMDLNKMIPCVDAHFLTLDDPNDGIVEMCNYAKHYILECADEIMTSRLA